ncbi:MAG: T9SS type A sorting domain-containing protein [Cytophagales bacterium]|nr:T9SS type A sorting domain-containing protein [Cytophagales bacterium]
MSGGGLSRTLFLLQHGTPAYLTVAADTVQLSAAGESRTLPIASNLSWQITGSAPWLTVEPPTGKGSGAVALSAPANESGGSRSCTLTVTAGSLSRTILVEQLAKADSVPTSLPSPGLGSRLVLAPNPARHLLKLTLGGQSGPLLPVQLYNSLGQNVASYTLPVVDGKVETVLQVAHLPRGLYVLQVHTATGLQRGKLLLQ